MNPIKPDPGTARKLPHQRFGITAKLATIVLVFVGALVVLMVVVLLSFRIATGVRAYIGGEGLWSKGQKDAVYYLQRYVSSGGAEDYAKYHAAVSITLGDRIAREEMLKADFDPEVVERGFVQGMNAAADVPPMIFLFRRFGNFSYMSDAIAIWTEADAEIANLMATAADLRRDVSRLDAAREREYLDRIEQINNRLTPLERQFSDTLAEAARGIRDILLAIVLSAALLLLAGGLWVSWRIAQGIRGGLDELQQGILRIDQGNLGQPIMVSSHDELGELAAAFNKMMAHRQEVEQALVLRSEELARSNSELEQFAYVASHDLQEPLRTVASYAQLLVRRSEGKLGPEADEFVRYINEAVVRMRALIDDLLSYSRVSRDANPQVSSSLDTLLDDALSNLAAAVDEHGVTVTRDPLPTLRVIPHLVTQLLQNLVGNAIKFCGTAPPRIHIGARRIGARWEFSVRDNGIGIAPEHFERVFLLFQRLHSRDAYPGSGLGLAICKKIVEQQGGRIWIERVESGSDFRFTLPVDPVG